MAIVLTLFQHYPMLAPFDRPPWFNLIYEYLSFWGGVDVFFVVSGYIVTTSLLAEMNGAKSFAAAWPAMKRFWIRRAFRLFPLAWAWLAIVLAATLWLNESRVFGTLADNARQAFLIVVYVYNWFAYGFVQSGVNIGALGPYWSLSVEEQFYLALPLLLVFFPRRALPGVLAAAIAVQFFLWRPGPWLEPLWGLRFDGLAWGVLLAFLARTPWHGKLEPRWLSPRAGALALNAVLLALIVALSMPFLQVRIITGVVVLASAVWVWLATYESGYVLPIARLRPLMLWFGARSYSLYLAHVPVFMAVTEITFRMAKSRGVAMDSSWLAMHTLAAAIALPAVAELGYRLIERPLRDYGRGLAGRQR